MEAPRTVPLGTTWRPGEPCSVRMPAPVSALPGQGRRPDAGLPSPFPVSSSLTTGSSRRPGPGRARFSGSICMRRSPGHGPRSACSPARLRLAVVHSEDPCGAGAGWCAWLQPWWAQPASSPGRGPQSQGRGRTRSRPERSRSLQVCVPLPCSQPHAGSTLWTENFARGRRSPLLPFLPLSAALTPTPAGWQKHSS